MTDSFLSELSSPDQPIPGGGAAAAHAGIVGLALLEKIIRVEISRHPGPPENSPWDDLLHEILALRENLYRLRGADGKSYIRLAQARKSGEGPEEIMSALRQAIDCPMGIMEQTPKALGCVAETAKYCKKHLLSDLRVVCELLEAAGRGADHIARENLNLMADPITKADYQNRLDSLYARVSDAIQRAEGSILAKI